MFCFAATEYRVSIKQDKYPQLGIGSYISPYGLLCFFQHLASGTVSGTH